MKTRPRTTTLAGTWIFEVHFSNQNSPFFSLLGGRHEDLACGVEKEKEKEKNPSN